MQKKNLEHVSTLKELIKSYKSDLFDNGTANIVTTGIEAFFKIIQWQFKAPEQEKHTTESCRNKAPWKTESIYLPITQQNIKSH